MKHNFRELKIWNMGIDNAAKTYLQCASFPKEDLYGLTLQMKKAAVSIPSNIAEGCGRGTDAQVIHFLDIALGSSCELETQVVIAQRLKFLTQEVATQWISELNDIQKKTRHLRDKLVQGLEK